ncbi:MAG: hypothetical protein ACM3X6_04075 [Patescibacteria group bacterium]
MSGAFILASSGTVLARAEKPGAFRRAFMVEHTDSRYTLRAASVFGREFLLIDGGLAVGSILSGGILHAPDKGGST